MNSFIRKDNQLYKIPEGLNYTLEPSRIYRIAQKQVGFRETETIVTIDGFIEENKKVYASESEKKFSDKIAKYFKNHDDNTVGVFLYGEQGCGKTFSAKLIAKKTNLPVFIIDPSFPTSELMNYFSKITDEIVIIFDEYDKYYKRKWDSKPLLEFLDGIQKTSKKLIIFTANDENCMNEFMVDRTGRIRYYRKFTTIDKDMIHVIVNDKVSDKSRIDEITDFIDEFITLKSYDNIISFIDEVLDNPEDTLFDLARDMNLTLKGDPDRTVNKKENSPQDIVRLLRKTLDEDYKNEIEETDEVF